MLKETIATGDTVEIALQNACKELGVEISDAEFEILETPTKKTFGLFGGNPAKVRVFVNESDPAKEAANFLTDVLEKMGLIDITVDIKEEETGAALTLSGSDIGFIIGHRGETLDALQYLASLVANHVDDKYFRITLDVGNYREKRKDTLESLGKKVAIKSVKTGRNNFLEPMNPYERRIIHTAVQEIEGAKSWSEGEDMERHVVIGPVDGERYPRRDYQNRGNNHHKGGFNKGGYNKDGRNNNNRYGNRTNSNNNRRRPTQNTKPSDTPKRDDPSAPVYGRLDVKK